MDLWILCSTHGDNTKYISEKNSLLDNYQNRQLELKTNNYDSQEGMWKEKVTLRETFRY